MLNHELILPCGVVIKNRIAKSAMSENMGSHFHANEKFISLYKKWSSGGAGLLITGNVMIDAGALGEPNNVVIAKEILPRESLKEWAKAGRENNTQIWVQLNHPGKQSPKFLSPTPVAPSALGFPSPMNKLFHKPRALSEVEIKKIIQAFGYAAKVAKDCGFTGVQIHGAHGYLVSQFLSPKHNQRTDSWGGSLKNRMRFLMEVYQEMRLRVGETFPISVKLNSADFQKGAFTQEESLEVIKALDKASIDLIEISGGTYESSAMMGNIKAMKESTQKREAYFIEFSRLAKTSIKCPIMLTGGFRTKQGMQEALQSGATDLIGLGRSVVLDPNFPTKLLSQQDVQSPVHPLSTGLKFLDKVIPLEIIWYTEQIHRMGKGQEPNPKLSPLCVALSMVKDLGLQSLKRVRA
jgi:2,4-dienoyl-CoA reductase-like NADH-dependent reductase (Old Yellow Enzyme family)